MLNTGIRMLSRALEGVSREPFDWSLEGLSKDPREALESSRRQSLEDFGEKAAKRDSQTCCGARQDQLEV